MRILERIRQQIIGTPLDPVARQVRRWRTAWTIRNHPEIRDAMFEDDLLKEVCRRVVKNGMNCVDVGAHLGAMTAEFLALSPAGKHAAVEPTPYKAAWLRGRYRQVDVFEVALAEAPGEATFFHQERNSGYSGLARHEAGVNDSNHIQTMTVRIDTLDRIIPDVRPVGFMKLDVEGAEIRVLRGGERILTRDRPTFIFECTASCLSSSNTTSGELFGLLSARGYAIRTPRQFLEGKPALGAEQLEQSIHYPFQAFSFIASPV